MRGSTIVRTVLGVTVAAGLATAGGCLALAAGAAAGVGTYAYVKGEASNTFEASLDRTHAAAVRAMEDLGFPLESDSRDALEARVAARQADNTRVTINLQSLGENLTEVKVRVGTFGDESESRLIMDKIRENL
ncbi:MAG: DUF3568 family protein [Phycisphaerales bacterium]